MAKSRCSSGPQHSHSSAAKTRALFQIERYHSPLLVILRSCPFFHLIASMHFLNGKAMRKQRTYLWLHDVKELQVEFIDVVSFGTMSLSFKEKKCGVL